MKKDLIALIDDIVNIEKLFHTLSVPNGVIMLPTEHISNSPEFQIWRQKVLRELQSIYSVKKDDFIKGTIDALSTELNSYHERKDFNNIKGKLLAIRENIDAYYALEGDCVNMETKEPMIFISHSTLDKRYAEKIVELLETMGLDEKTVFCSSVPGYDVKLGKDIYEHLRALFLTRNLHIIYLLSKNFYDSPASLNEMGAAWVLKKEVTSILLPNFDFSDMKGVVDNREIAIKIEDEDESVKDKLNQLYSKIVEEFSLQKKNMTIWERKRDSFIQQMRDVTSLCTSSKVSTSKVTISYEACQILNEAVKTNHAQIIVTHNLSSGKCIQAGAKSYSGAMGAREFSKWDAAFDELLTHGYIKEIGHKHEVFQVTDKGFSYIESKV
ncbi:toll/interleukin-1 receptor domain-containing protein [Pumilibacter muris]|uniref:toll/interleukin-1 receptor domain-containing protein n=1 Tax=Pumilibacter muris TaxID=2941510 RepID=UPI00203C69B2|nr:toll/interleukin-1 receptor domain-containing protein [Pumilibacter muris]